MGVCVLLPVALLFGILVTKMSAFLQTTAVQAEGGQILNSLSEVLVSARNWVENMTGSAPPIEDLKAAIFTSLKEAGKKFYELSPRMLSTTLSIVANFFLTLLFLTVFFVEGAKFYSWFMGTSPLSAEHRSEFAREVRITITTSILAVVVTAIVQGGLLGLGFWFAGFNEPYGWGLVAAILCIIPVVGASSCYLTASIILFSIGDVYGALIFLVFGFVIVSGVDNIIRILLIRGTVRMHPLLLFVVLIGSMKFMGPIGLLVGPVFLAIFLSAIRIYRREFAATGS